MKYTYKLDEKGLPYRAINDCNETMNTAERKSCCGLTLLHHGGKLRTFNLYNIGNLSQVAK